MDKLSGILRGGLPYTGIFPFHGSFAIIQKTVEKKPVDVPAIWDPTDPM